MSSTRGNTNRNTSIFRRIVTFLSARFGKKHSDNMNYKDHWDDLEDVVPDDGYNANRHEWKKVREDLGRHAIEHEMAKGDYCRTTEWVELIQRKYERGTKTQLPEWVLLPRIVKKGDTRKHGMDDIGDV